MSRVPNVSSATARRRRHDGGVARWRCGGWRCGRRRDTSAPTLITPWNCFYFFFPRFFFSSSLFFFFFFIRFSSSFCPVCVSAAAVVAAAFSVRGLSSRVRPRARYFAPHTALAVVSSSSRHNKIVNDNNNIIIVAITLQYYYCYCYRYTYRQRNLAVTDVARTEKRLMDSQVKNTFIFQIRAVFHLRSVFRREYLFFFSVAVHVENNPGVVRDKRANFEFSL